MRISDWSSDVCSSDLRHAPRSGPACCSSGTRRQGPREGSTKMSEQASNQRIYSRIAGTGSYLPEKVLTNDDLAKIVDTSDEWITSRTGIRQRHVAAEGETTGDPAYHAAVRAMEAAGVEASEIDLIVPGTTTPDILFPSPACLLQHRPGANGCPAFAVNPACSGLVDELSVADQVTRPGRP